MLNVPKLTTRCESRQICDPRVTVVFACIFYGQLIHLLLCSPACNSSQVFLSMNCFLCFGLFLYFYATVDTPIRIKRMIVEKHQLTKRWEEEVLLIKKEMTNFISWHMDGQIPQLRKIAEDLQVQGNS